MRYVSELKLRSFVVIVLLTLLLTTFIAPTEWGKITAVVFLLLGAVYYFSRLLLQAVRE